MPSTWWTFRIILFFLLGEGEGGVRGARKGGGDRFFIENPTGGGFQKTKGREGVRGELGNLGGGGGKYFFSDPKRPPRI